MNVDVDTILMEISEKHGVSISELKGKRRNAKISRARTEGYILLREKHNLTFIEIAAVFNRKYSNVVQMYHRHKNEFLNKDIKALKKNEDNKSFFELLLKERQKITIQLDSLNNQLDSLNGLISLYNNLKK